MTDVAAEVLKKKFSFGETKKAAEREGLMGGSGYLKLKEGANRMRLVSECVPHPGTYQGRKTFKWLCYVLDRVDGKVKPFFMPHTIYKQIEALQTNPDYEFFDVPMPYDLTVSAKGAGTKEVEYTVMPARKETPLTPEELEDIATAKPLDELQAALKEKKRDDEDVHSQPVDDADVPFAWLIPILLPLAVAAHHLLV